MPQTLSRGAKGEDKWKNSDLRSGVDGHSDHGRRGQGSMVISDPYTEPNLEASALITIDVQRDTLDGRPLEVPGTSAALPAMRALRESYRAAGRLIVHVVRIYRPDGSNVDLCRRAAVERGARILAPGTDGCQLASELLPDPAGRLDDELLLRGELQRLSPHETVIYKPRWGAFFRTPLEDHLRGAGVDTLIFCGCNFPNCPRTSIYEASERDFRIVVARDALSGLYPAGAVELESLGVRLWTSTQIASAIRATMRSSAAPRP